jgi:hypothetical protein
MRPKVPAIMVWGFITRPYLITSDRDAGPAALKTGTPGSAAVVEGHLVAVGVGERERAAERPVDGR